jgi:hypothetical protein
MTDVRQDNDAFQARGYVDWGAILAGAALATAISLTLFAFGAGLGLSIVSPREGEGVSATWVSVAAGIWFVWVAISSFAAGGYLTGRLRRRIGDATASEVETRDGAHGLTMWAAAAIVGAVLASTGATTLAGSAAGAAANMSDEADYFTSRLLRSPTGQWRGSQDVRSEAAAIIARSVARGEIATEDRDHLARILAANAQMDEAAARAQVDAAVAQAIEAADQARVAGLISAFASCFGGRHRDEGVAFATFGRRT